MSFVLTIYSPRAFQEFLLLAVNNTEHSIILNRDVFSLRQDVELQMEVIENRWHFLRKDNYRIESTVEGKDYIGVDLKDEDLLTLFLDDGEAISIMADEMETSFRVFEKFDIRNVDNITIGKKDDNDIRFNTRKLISGRHAVIKKSRVSVSLRTRVATVLLSTLCVWWGADSLFLGTASKFLGFVLFIWAMSWR